MWPRPFRLQKLEQRLVLSCCRGNGHHQPLPSLANTGPGWIKLCGYSRRYRAGPHHHREPWGQARTRQRSLLIRSQSVSVVTMFHALKIMPSFSHFPFDLTKIFDFLSIAISPQFLVVTAIEFSSIYNWNQLAAMDFMCFRFDPKLDKWPNSEHVNCKQWCSSHKEKFLELQLMMLI